MSLSITNTGEKKSLEKSLEYSSENGNKISILIRDVLDAPCSHQGHEINNCNVYSFQMNRQNGNGTELQRIVLNVDDLAKKLILQERDIVPMLSQPGDEKVSNDKVKQNEKQEELRQSERNTKNLIDRCRVIEGLGNKKIKEGDTYATRFIDEKSESQFMYFFHEGKRELLEIKKGKKMLGAGAQGTVIKGYRGFEALAFKTSYCASTNLINLVKKREAFKKEYDSLLVLADEKVPSIQKPFYHSIEYKNVKWNYNAGGGSSFKNRIKRLCPSVNDKGIISLTKNLRNKSSLEEILSVLKEAKEKGVKFDEKIELKAIAEKVQKSIARRSDNIYFVSTTKLYQGDLASLGKDLSLKKKINLCYELSYALPLMHKAGIYHGDIKPANILLDEKNDAVFADFGGSVLTYSKDWSDPERGDMSTPNFTNPTIMNKVTKMRKKAKWKFSLWSSIRDMYALACTLERIFESKELDAKEELAVKSSKKLGDVKDQNLTEGKIKSLISDFKKKVEILSKKKILILSRENICKKFSKACKKLLDEL